MPAKTAAPMKDIYDRLSKVGITRAYVKKYILPDWWEDSIAEVPANRVQAEMILSRQLGIDLHALHDRKTRLRPRSQIVAKFKERGGVKVAQLDVAAALAARVAEIAALSIDAPLQLDALSALTIRQRILDDGARWVGFENLLDFCWRVGVPVVHVAHFPTGCRKMNGMATLAKDRPVIVLTHKRKQPAWQLFILAHELGHIIRGHLNTETVAFVDEKVNHIGAGTESPPRQVAHSASCPLPIDGSYLEIAPPTHANRRGGFPTRP